MTRFLVELDSDIMEILHKTKLKYPFLSSRVSIIRFIIHEFADAVLREVEIPEKSTN